MYFTKPYFKESVCEESVCVRRTKCISNVSWEGGTGTAVIYYYPAAPPGGERENLKKVEIDRYIYIYSIYIVQLQTLRGI